MRRFRKNTQNLSSYELAQNRVECLKKFYISLFIYAIGLSFFLVKEYGKVEFNLLPIKYINWFVMSIWTFFIVVKALKLFVKNTILGTDWENRKIQQFMQNENRKTQSWE